MRVRHVNDKIDVYNAPQYNIYIYMQVDYKLYIYIIYTVIIGSMIATLFRSFKHEIKFNLGFKWSSSRLSSIIAMIFFIYSIQQ